MSGMATLRLDVFLGITFFCYGRQMQTILYALNSLMQHSVVSNFVVSGILADLSVCLRWLGTCKSHQAPSFHAFLP
jgi:hypothetical protein